MWRSLTHCFRLFRTSLSDKALSPMPFWRVGPPQTPLAWVFFGGPYCGRAFSLENLNLSYTRPLYISLHFPWRIRAGSPIAFLRPESKARTKQPRRSGVRHFRCRNRGRPFDIFDIFDRGSHGADFGAGRSGRSGRRRSRGKPTALGSSRADMARNDNDAISTHHISTSTDMATHGQPADCSRRNSGGERN